MCVVPLPVLDFELADVDRLHFRQYMPLFKELQAVVSLLALSRVQLRVRNLSASQLGYFTFVCIQLLLTGWL